MAGHALATLFMPAWLLPWIAVLAIGALIVGARSLAIFLFTLLAVELVLVPMLGVWLESWPLWAVLLAAVIFALSIVNGLIALVFGKEAAGNYTGTMLVRLTDLILSLSFRSVRSIVNFVRRR